jgi:YHS domain
LPDKKLYQLRLTDKHDKVLVFEGNLKRSYLTLERFDSDTREKQELKWNTASAGDRLVVTYSMMPPNRTVFNQVWQVGMTREGVALAAGTKRPECIVTGGLGTISVNYKGATYYVCCGGCRDAFNEDPQKYIKEFDAKKKK